MLTSMSVRGALIAIACAISMSAHAIADTPKQIDIPAGELRSALLQLSKTFGVELLYQPGQLKDFRTKGVRGTYTPDAAIRILLKGTPLELRTDPSGAMLIAPHGASTTAAQSSPGADGDGADKEGKKSSSDQFLVAQVDQGQTSSAATVEKPEEQLSKRKLGLEEVVVTGSRIPTAAGQQVVPVSTYTRADIDQSGQTTLGDFLNNLPDVSTSSSEAIGIVGQTTVSLHGLPVGTTLVLINGHRVETSYSNYFDLSNIPVSAVERIEVLPVGASAIYGADALGGAVNIILRKNFDGFEGDGRFDHAAGLNDTSANLGWGKSWERGSVSLLGTYQERGELLGNQRTLTSTTDVPANAASFFLTDACSPGNVYSLSGQNLPGLSSPQAGIPAGISGTPAIQQFVATTGRLNQCNTYQNFTVIPYSRREGALISANYRVSESMEFFTEIMTSHEDVQAYENLLIDGTGGSYGGTILGVNNPYNPFGEAVGVSFAYPGLRGGVEETGDLIQPLIGVRGSLPSDWHYEATAYLSRDRFQVNETSEVQAFDAQGVLQAALNSSSPATALNPFTTGVPGTPQALRSFLAMLSGPAVVQQFENQLVDGQGILRGPLFNLPAGPVETAVGGEYGTEKQDTENYDVRPLLYLHRTTYAVFGEVRIPLLADPDQPEGGDRLTLPLGGRYDHSDDFGGKGTWQTGLLWRANDSLSLSGSYGVSYKAPQLQEIGGGNATLFSGTVGTDPFRGGQSVTAPVVAGANPNLKPETGNSRTLGITYKSRTLRASLTNFAVNISNYIASPSFQTLIDNPTLYPGAVLRGPVTPQDQQQGYLGAITQLNDLYYNFGDIHVAGFDADASYTIDSRAGQFIPSLSLANIYKWQSALVPGSPLINYVSQATLDGVGFAPRWKGTASFAWKRGPLSANLTGRYLGPYRDYQDLVSNTNELGDYWIFDLNVRYESGQGARQFAGTYIALGAVNLLDKMPQFSYGAAPYDYYEADLRGRIVYVQAGVKWK
jgi:iron complex outermembrane receptor protein